MDGFGFRPPASHRASDESSDHSGKGSPTLGSQLGIGDNAFGIPNPATLDRGLVEMNGGMPGRALSEASVNSSVAATASRAAAMMARAQRSYNVTDDWNARIIKRYGLPSDTIFPEGLQDKLNSCYAKKTTAMVLEAVDKIKGEIEAVCYASPTIRVHFEQIEKQVHCDALMKRLNELAAETSGQNGKVNWNGINSKMMAMCGSCLTATTNGQQDLQKSTTCWTGIVKALNTAISYQTIQDQDSELWIQWFCMAIHPVMKQKTLDEVMQFLRTNENVLNHLWFDRDRFIAPKNHSPGDDWMKSMQERMGSTAAGYKGGADKPTKQEEEVAKTTKDRASTKRRYTEFMISKIEEVTKHEAPLERFHDMKTRINARAADKYTHAITPILAVLGQEALRLQNQILGKEIRKEWKGILDGADAATLCMMADQCKKNRESGKKPDINKSRSVSVDGNIGVDQKKKPQIAVHLVCKLSIRQHAIDLLGPLVEKELAMEDYLRYAPILIEKLRLKKHDVNDFEQLVCALRDCCMGFPKELSFYVLRGLLLENVKTLSHAIVSEICIKDFLAALRCVDHKVSDLAPLLTLRSDDPIEHHVRDMLPEDVLATGAKNVADKAAAKAKRHRDRRAAKAERLRQVKKKEAAESAARQAEENEKAAKKQKQLEAGSKPNKLKVDSEADAKRRKTMKKKETLLPPAAEESRAVAAASSLKPDAIMGDGVVVQSNQNDDGNMSFDHVPFGGDDIAEDVLTDDMSESDTEDQLSAHEKIFGGPNDVEHMERVMRIAAAAGPPIGSIDAAWNAVCNANKPSGKKRPSNSKQEGLPLSLEKLKSVCLCAAAMVSLSSVKLPERDDGKRPLYSTYRTPTAFEAYQHQFFTSTDNVDVICAADPGLLGVVQLENARLVNTLEDMQKKVMTHLVPNIDETLSQIEEFFHCHENDWETCKKGCDYFIEPIKHLKPLRAEMFESLERTLKTIEAQGRHIAYLDAQKQANEDEISI